MSDLLATLSEPHALPVTLPLPDGSELMLETAVRSVPGKRLVCRGEWQGQFIFAKLFFGKDAGKYAQRDKRGSDWLREAGILTPRLLHVTTLGQHAEALIYAAVASDGNAEDVWRRVGQDDKARFDLMAQLTEVVARHHAAGLMQTDLYLKNFLLSVEGVHTLDGDGIRMLKDRKTHLHNLAILFSKMDVLDDVWIPELYRRYAAWAGLPVPDTAAIAAMQAQAHDWRRKTVSAYADRKVFRNCTDVKVRRGPKHFLAIARQWLDQANALAHPAPYFGDLQLARLKDGNTCTVSLAKMGERRLVIKRYNIKNFWHGLDRAWRKSRAAISWANAHRLVMYGIATPRPVALLEERWGPVRRQAYFFAEYLEAVSLAEYLEGGAADDEKKALTAAVARLFYKLYVLQLEHGDCKASNIRVADGLPWLIDLDAMRQHKDHARFVKRHVRDLRRLLRNWPTDSAIHGWMADALRDSYQDQRPLALAGVLTYIDD